MILPREGSRTVREGIIVAEAMDWCRSPTAIVPYRIYTHHQVEGAGTADSVRQTDERSHVRGSLIRQCYGDEPGVGGGVRSGTRGAECEPKTWSSSVRAEGRPMVRHDDEWWMNHRNTYGKLIYTKDMERAEVADPRAIVPLMDDGRRVGAVLPEATSFADPASSVGAAGVVIQGGRIVIPPLINGARAGAVLIGSVLVEIFTGARTSRRPNECPCVVAPYRQMSKVCSKAYIDGEAHHIMPDQVKRYGSRKEGIVRLKRIRGLAGYWDGMSICVRGQKETPGSEHWVAHQVDKEIEKLGNNHPDTPSFPKGTSPIREIRRVSEKQMIVARSKCAEQIKSGFDEEPGNANPNMLGRTYGDSRLPPSSYTISALSSQYPTVH